MRPRPGNPTRNRVTSSTPSTTNSTHGMRATNLPRAAAARGKVGWLAGSVRVTTRPLAPMRGGFWRMRGGVLWRLRWRGCVVGAGGAWAGRPLFLRWLASGRCWPPRPFKTWSPGGWRRMTLLPWKAGGENTRIHH